MLPEALRELVDSAFEWGDGVPIHAKADIWAQAVELGMALGIEVKAPDWRSPDGVSVFWWMPAVLLRVTRPDWEQCCYKYAADCVLHAFPLFSENYGGPESASEEHHCLEILRKVASGQEVSPEARSLIAGASSPVGGSSYGWWSHMTGLTLCSSPENSVHASHYAADNRISEKTWQSDRLMEYAWGVE